MSAFAKSFLAAQKEMGVALKDSKNPFFKSKYADLNSVIDACVPVLNKHGITVNQPTTFIVVGDKAIPVVRTTLVHSDSGEREVSDTEIICAKPNDPQAMGSAISYARRYGLQAFVVLKAEDDDGNSGAGKTASAEVAPVKKISPSAERVSFARQAPKKTVDVGDEL